MRKLDWAESAQMAAGLVLIGATALAFTIAVSFILYAVWLISPWIIIGFVVIPAALTLLFRFTPIGVWIDEHIR